MQTQIYPQQWLALPKETRQHLIKVFGLERTGVTEIRDQDVVSDGYTVDDLKKISLEKMIEYIGSTETFGRAWEITLAKVHAELNPPIAIIQNVNGEPTAVDIVVDEVVTPVATGGIKEEVRIRCEICYAKDGAHKEDCPNYVAVTPTTHAN